MITKPFTPEEHYKRLAVDFKGQAKLRRCDAAVHVEAAQDQLFWGTIFHHFVPHLKFHFITHSRTWRGSDATGVTQCLNFKPYLGKDFFICIDSDYRYLMQEYDINIRHSIFQTYTYAIENHYCAAPGLDYVCQRATGVTNEVFDFELFLKNYSEIVFELFLWHIYSHTTFDFKFGRWEFYQIIALRRNAPYPDIKDNGDSELYFMNERVQFKLNWLRKMYPLTDLEPLRKKLTDLGVSSDNVYLFIRGHNLFEAIVAVGRKVCEKLLETRKIRQNNQTHRIAEIYSGGHDFEHHIKHNFSFGRYHEMDKIKKDIELFFNLVEIQH